MSPPTSGVPPSRDHQFSTLSVPHAAPSLSGPLMPNLLAPTSQSPNRPASPFSYQNNNFTPRSTRQISVAMESHHSLQPYNSYDESMLTPHRTGYCSSSFRTTEFPSEKTTPSFDPEDSPEDLEMLPWVGDETLSLFPPLGVAGEGLGAISRGVDIAGEYLAASATNPTTAATIRPLSPVMATSVPRHHNAWTIPKSPLQAESTQPMKRLAKGDEPIITHIRRTGTDESTSSWMVSPIVRVEDTENSEVSLAF